MSILFSDRISARLLAIFLYFASSSIFALLRHGNFPDLFSYSHWFTSNVTIFLVIRFVHESGNLHFSNPIRRRYFSSGYSHHRRVFVFQSVWEFTLCFPSNLLVNVIQKSYFLPKLGLGPAIFLWCASLVFLADLVTITFQKWHDSTE